MTRPTTPAGISGHVMTKTNAKARAANAITAEANNTRTRTIEPMILEIKLSKAARTRVSNDRPGGVTMRRHGENKVRTSMGTEKCRRTPCGQDLTFLAAFNQPALYHHRINSISMSLLYPKAARPVRLLLRLLPAKVGQRQACQNNNAADGY